MANAGAGERGEAGAPAYWLTRFVFLRLLGLVYTVAFLIALLQWEPLLGSRGLLPARLFLEGAARAWGHGPLAFLHLPTVF